MKKKVIKKYAVLRMRFDGDHPIRKICYCPTRRDADDIANAMSHVDRDNIYCSVDNVKEV